MSAGIIYGKKQIEKALRDLGCEPIETFKGEKTKPHSMWKTPWGHLFMAPDEGCGHWVVQDIIDKEIESTRPKKN